MRKSISLSILLTTVFFAATNKVEASAKKDKAPKSGVEKFEEYLIRFNEELKSEERQQIYKKYNFIEKREVKTSFGIFYVIGVPSGKTRNYWEGQMKNESKVKYIEPQIMYKAFGNKNPNQISTESTNSKAGK
ncbi:MAG: hypothetical protein KA116_04195 [Proteobacteria bacterium]|nr:hypothetical protein [Pseudomonadota bacterium]